LPHTSVVEAMHSPQFVGFALLSVCLTDSEWDCSKAMDEFS